MNFEKIMPPFMLALAVFVTCLSPSTLVAANAANQGYPQLTLKRVISLAQANDPWQQESEYRQAALQAQSNAASALPNPLLSVGFANLPMDSLEFNEDPMTQFKLGIAQQLPRGQSLQLEQKRLDQRSASHPYRRADRRARLAVSVTELYLDAYLASESMQLISRDRELFEYLVELVQSSYVSTAGEARQPDLIRAQLELTQLEDRLSSLRQQRDTALGKLGQWLGAAYQPASSVQWQAALGSNPIELMSELPQIELAHEVLLSANSHLERDWLADRLLDHPAMKALDLEIASSETGITLAQEQYKPQWAVNAGYGYRDDAPDGRNLDDFFSVGISVDLPLFSNRRQDRNLESAKADAEATKTRKWLLLREMRSAVATQRARLQRLEDRLRLYEERLLLQAHEQAEAALSAYTNDRGDFSEVVRARIAELNANIETLRIRVDHSRSKAALNYYLAQHSTQQHVVEGGSL